MVGPHIVILSIDFYNNIFLIGQKLINEMNDSFLHSVLSTYLVCGKYLKKRNIGARQYHERQKNGKKDL